MRVFVFKDFYICKFFADLINNLLMKEDNNRKWVNLKQQISLLYILQDTKMPENQLALRY